jgi:hypothetical protein
MVESHLLTSRSSSSRRTAIVCEEEDSVWLYLTAPDSETPERDCWLLNKPSASPNPDMEAYRARSAPPPAPARFISPEGVRELPPRDRWTFRWSEAGDAVLVAVDGRPIGFVGLAYPRGISRYVVRDTPWGSTWNEEAVIAAIEGGVRPPPPAP